MEHRDLTPFNFPNDLFWKHPFPDYLSNPLRTEHMQDFQGEEKKF